jgi:hypothetical protein
MCAKEESAIEKATKEALAKPMTATERAEAARALELYEADRASWELQSPGCDAVSAATTAEFYVKRQLKSPKTADFASYNQDNVKRLPDGRITYVSYVDSQNAFGATLRMYFKVWMECRSGGLTVVDAKYEQ